MIIAYASAGLIGQSIGIGGLGIGGLGHGGLVGGLGHGGLVVAQPAVAVAHAPIAVKAGASSYQNNNLLAIHPVPVVAHAPVAVAHAPLAVGLGHGLLH